MQKEREDADDRVNGSEEKENKHQTINETDNNRQKLFTKNTIIITMSIERVC